MVTVTEKQLEEQLKLADQMIGNLERIAGNLRSRAERAERGGRELLEQVLHAMGRTLQDRDEGRVKDAEIEAFLASKREN